MAKVIKTPADFEKTRLDGEDFDRYIIPGDVFVKIAKGGFVNKNGWEEFQEILSFDNYTSVVFQDNLIVYDDIYFGVEEINIVVHINGGIYSKFIFGEDSKVNRGFQINGGVFLDDFQFENCIFNHFLTITGGVFKSTFCASNTPFNTGIEISGGEFYDLVEFSQNSKIVSIDISGGVFHRMFAFTVEVIVDELKISGGLFNDTFIFNNSTVKDNFSLSGGIFKESLILKNVNISRMDITDSVEVYNKIYFANITSEQIFIKNSNKITIDIDIEIDNKSNTEISNYNSVDEIIISDEIKNTINISYTKIGFLSFFELVANKDVVISITKVNIDKLYFYEAINFGNIIFKSCRTIPKDNNPMLLLNYSDLGRTQFIDCDFSKAKIFDFKSTRLTEIFIAGTIFPRKITTKGYSQRRLGYGQLKKVYENRGDLIEARKYYAKEMIAYWQTLKWYSFGEHILLALNAISNGFTRYWMLGIGFTIAVTYLFFYLYCNALGLEWVSIIDKYNGAEIPNRAGKVFVFFQPWHKPDEVFKDIPNNNLSLLWDFISRLFIAFGIYQTIAAFRKHGRSGA